MFSGFTSHGLMDNSSGFRHGDVRWSSSPDDTAGQRSMRPVDNNVGFEHGDGRWRIPANSTSGDHAWPGSHRNRRPGIRDNNQCDPCLFDNDFTQANGFCMSCLENLCEDCVKSHTKSKLTRRHKILIGRNISTDVKAQQMLAYTVACPDHPGQVFDQFCGEHGRFVCPECIRKSHRKCETLDEIPAASEFDRKKLEHSFNEIYTLKELSAARKRAKLDNIHYIHREQFFVREGRCCLASILYELLLQDETNSSDKIDQLVSEKIACLGKGIAELEEFERDQTAVLRLIDAAIEHGSEKHIQVVMSRVNSHIQSMTVTAEKLELRYRIDIDSANPDHQAECAVKETEEPIDKTVPEDHDKINKERKAMEDRLSFPNRTNASDDAESKTEVNKKKKKTKTSKTVYSEVGGHMKAADDDVLNTSDFSTRDTNVEASAYAGSFGRAEDDNIEAHSSASETEKHDDVPFESNVSDHTVPAIKTCTFSAKPDKERSIAQRKRLMTSGVRFVAKYKAAGKSDKQTCSISSILVLPNGTFVMTDCKNNWVKVYDGDFKFEFGSRLSFRPNDMCFHDGNEVIIVGEKSVERYAVDTNENKLKFSGSFETKGECYAVSKHGKDIAILCVDGDQFEIQICQKYNGTILSTISTFKDQHKSALGDDIDPRSLLYSKHNGYIVGDQKSILRCFNDKGTERWYYKGRRKTKIMCVCGLAEDSDGNLYGCGGRSDNVHQISGCHFMDNRVVVSGLPGPVSVAVDQHRDRLVVGCNDDDYVHVYEFV